MLAINKLSRSEICRANFLPNVNGAIPDGNGASLGGCVKNDIFFKYFSLLNSYIKISGRNWLLLRNLIHQTSQFSHVTWSDLVIFSVT